MKKDNTQNNELKEVPYSVSLVAYHALNVELSGNDEFLLIVHDSLSKAQALFWAVGAISEMAATGHHKFNQEQLLLSIHELGEIGYAIAGNLVYTTEKLSEVKNEN